MIAQQREDGLELSVKLIAGGDAAEAAYSVFEVRAPWGVELPPHVSSKAGGALFVLEGEIEVVLGHERRVVGAGDVLALPRARPRRIRTLGDVRLLYLSVPAGLEQLVDVLAGPRVDADDMAALLAAAGVALLPPGWGAAAATL